MLLKTREPTVRPMAIPVLTHVKLEPSCEEHSAMSEQGVLFTALKIYTFTHAVQYRNKGLTVIVPVDHLNLARQASLMVRG